MFHEMNQLNNITIEQNQEQMENNVNRNCIDTYS